MESRDLVSRPVFSSLGLGLGLECLRSRLDLGLEGFRSRSRAISLETLHKLFFYEVLQEAAPLKRNCKVIDLNSAVKTRSVVKFSLLLCYGEKNSPSTLFNIFAEFNKNSVCVPVKS